MKTNIFYFITFIFFLSAFTFSQEGSTDICGSDDRISSNDPAVGRIIHTAYIYQNLASTGFIIANGKIVTAGHVFPLLQEGDWLEFNVKTSLSNGNLQYSDDVDRYMIDMNSISYEYKGNLASGYGKDWMVFSVLPNTVTGLTPLQAQQSYKLVNKTYNPGNVNIRITGYGEDNGSTNHTQQTAIGLYNDDAPYQNFHKYNTDTENGNSGSPIIDESTGFVIGVHCRGLCQSYGWNGGTSFTNTDFWNAVNLGNIIVLDQKRESGIRLSGTNISHYETRFSSDEFLDYQIPSGNGIHFQFNMNNTETFRGLQELVNSPIEKYYQWNNLTDVTNHKSFLLNNTVTYYTSNFKQIYSNVTIKNEYPEVSGLDPADDNIDFKDPWLIDYADPNFPKPTGGSYLRNRGMKLTGDDSLVFKSRSSPFSPNFTTSYNGDVYKGIFLNQPFTGSNPRYYSVRSQVQDVFISQTSRWHKFFCYEWTGTNASIQYSDRNETAIVFTNDNAIVTAKLKGTQLSNTGSFANSGQRKVIKCDYGYLHLVYESMGYVWYERSTDNGATWQIMNGGKPIDKNPSKSPSIDFYYGYQRLVIVYQTWAGDNSEFAAIKAACFANGQLQFTTTVYESYLSIYSEVNYKPAVGYASNDKIAVAWEDYGVWVKTGVLSFSTNQVTWNNIIGVDNNNTANINPTIAAYKTTPGTATFHLAWQNNYSTIRYCNLTEQSKGSFLVSAVDQVSQGCGFPVNYYPSINVSNSNDVQLVWIGTPYYGSTYRKALSRSRTTNWSSSFAQYGNNVLSPDVAFYTGSSVVSWSENPSGNTYTNKFIKYGSVKTAGTTGKDVRIFNASTLQDMHLVSFTTNSLPYAFTHSANLNNINKDNSLVMASGVQAVAFKDGVEYFFRIGDINFNGSNIDFESFEDTSGVLSLEDLNTNLITNSFTANENNSLVYSIEYGVTDSVLALVQLQNKFISFKVELIDQLTGVVLAELNDIQMDGNNVEKLKTATFSFNITGLPNSSLAIRLKVNNDLEPQYAAAVIKSDESVLLKNNPVDLNLSGTETVKEYALDQNYPNPFNPSTIIKFQIPKDGFVSVKVYDILGNEITTLVNEEKSQGRYEVIFNASSLASGVYIYKIQTGDFISVKNMILLK